MTTIPEPAAKRRKVEDSRDPDYVAIAKTSTEIEWNEHESAQPKISQSRQIPVVLKDVSLDNGMVRGRFVSAIRDISLRLLFTRSASSSDSVGEMLWYSSALESIHKYKKDRPPLVCSSIALTPSSEDLFHLEVQILWQNTANPRKQVSAENLNILFRYLRAEELEQRPTALAQSWNPRDFYDNVHVPASNSESSTDIADETMTCRLYPFQRRAARWLLKCEGVQLDQNGRLQSEERDVVSLPPSFFESHDVNGHPIYVSQLLGCVSRNSQDLRLTYPEVRGGILAEEMGLGKTVELIALICLHRRHDYQQTTDGVVNLTSQRDGILTKSRATLIITPPSILDQWKQELEEHAPTLKVRRYNGLKASDRRSNDNLILGLANNDVVLTTYNVLAQEIHYAQVRPDRKLRERVRYEPPKSPLTEISWWRVCLDEAQMVESGVSQAAQVAQLIPRTNAWAVSGTPLRSEHKDLYGLFLFLRWEPLCQSPLIWNRLLDFYRPLFKQLLGKVAIRHSKNLVRDDLQLPSQARHTITIPFSAIEQQHYDQLFQEMCEDVGLDTSGGPLDADWNPDDTFIIDKMKRWLNRLRQRCLHPDNRRVFGRKNGPLRSAMQVLEVMTDQNEGAIRAEQRLILLSQLRRGQLYEYAKAPGRAIEIWKTAYSQATKVVTECRLLLLTETEKLKLKNEQDGEDEEYDDSRLVAHKQRLRAALEVLHMSVFFAGNACFQMKLIRGADPEDLDSKVYEDWERQEEAAFEEAKRIRAELLSEILRKAGLLMDKVGQGAKTASLARIPDANIVVEGGGIESRQVLRKLHLFCEAINAQAAQYINFRDRMANLLRQPLMDTEDGSIEISGQEYEASTKHQDEMYVYMEGLRAISADRNDALTGQTNFLISHEMKLAASAANRGEGPAPQLLLQVLMEREDLRISPELGSLRGVISELRQLMTALQWQEGSGSGRAEAELSILSGGLKSAQATSSAQQKAISGIEKEVELFRDTMNSRLEYYRGLQKISDTVAPYEPVERGPGPGDPVDAAQLAACIVNERQRESKVSVLVAKHRYLAHLKADQIASGAQRICVICQSTFEQGTLTVCGHIYCRECILLWWNRARSCPTCKNSLKVVDFHDITYKPQNLVVQKETEQCYESPANSSGTASENSEHNCATNRIYSDVSATTLNEIKGIELRQGTYFGTKVDTMCRHVLWLRGHNPGSKAVFFSQYRFFLDILGAAMGKNDISFSRIDDKKGIENFKKSPTIECFLLHAKAHSAGLNLVNANHVFLCEPLINTAIELQAIARIHRIGQHRETTVWMYLVAGTVEESIYETSVARRSAHLQHGSKGDIPTSLPASAITARDASLSEEAFEAANSLALQSADLAKLLASGNSGGEVVASDDVWQCLFGKAMSMSQGLSAVLREVDTEAGRLLRVEAAGERREGQNTT